MKKILARLLCKKIKVRVKDITPSWIEPALMAGCDVPAKLLWRQKRPDPTLWQRFQIWLVTE